MISESAGPAGHFEKFVGVKFDTFKRPCARGLFPEPEKVRARLQHSVEDIGWDELGSTMREKTVDHSEQVLCGGRSDLGHSLQSSLCSAPRE